MYIYANLKLLRVLESSAWYLVGGTYKYWKDWYIRTSNDSEIKYLAFNKHTT